MLSKTRGSAGGSQAWASARCVKSSRWKVWRSIVSAKHPSKYPHTAPPVPPPLKEDDEDEDEDEEEDEDEDK